MSARAMRPQAPAGPAARRRAQHNGLDAAAGLARSWWGIALRAAAAVVFAAGLLLLPPQTVAALVLLFAAYVAADGILAIIAALGAGRRGGRWWWLIFEGSANLAAAGAVLAWQAAMLMPFVNLASIWAMVTGALMLAAARRLTAPHGRWLLVAAGFVSIAWGVLAAVQGDDFAADLPAARQWLLAYALLFGIALLLLTARLQRRQHADEARASVSRENGEE
jgi:uncharacterized membrane protein HdeD (DUF308 family)